MAGGITTNSHLLEYIALGTTFMHCCIMLFQQEFDMETKLLLYFFVLITLLVNNHYRGTRIHLWPLMTGFSLYSITLLFGILEEMAFYYYYLTCLTSLVVVYFFGTVENY